MSLAALQARLAAARQQVEINNRKIRRLKKAKQEMVQNKTRLNSRASYEKSLARSDSTYGEWTGNTQKELCNFFSSTIPSEFRYYIYLVDNVLDAICDEITRLENENYRLNGLIGELIAAINSLINAMETATN